MLLIIAIAFLLFFIALYLISPLIAPEPLQLQGAHVLVGGTTYLFSFDMIESVIAHDMSREHDCVAVAVGRSKHLSHLTVLEAESTLRFSLI